MRKASSDLICLAIQPFQQRIQHCGAFGLGRVDNSVLLQNGDQPDRRDALVANNLDTPGFHFHNFCNRVVVNDRVTLFFEAEYFTRFGAFSILDNPASSAFIGVDLQISLHLLVQCAGLTNKRRILGDLGPSIAGHNLA